MAYESWTVDGYALSAYAHDIETYDGLDDIPDRILADQVATGRHGVIPGVPYYGPGRKTVSMLVSTLDGTTGVNGATPDAQRANFDKNLDTLLRIFYRRNLMDVRRTMSDGTVRQAFCRTISGAKPSRVGLSAGRLQFDLQLPYSFWQDVANQSQSVSTNLSGAPLGNFAAGNAPISDMQIGLVGPLTNPRVTDPESGAWVQYNAAIGSGTTVNLFCDTLTTDGSLSNITHDGDPGWLTLHPGPSGYLVTTSSTAGTGSFTFTGKRKYLR